MFAEPCDHIERKIAALKLRIGVEGHGNLDRVGDRPEVRFDMRILERKVGLENRKDAVGAELLKRLRLRDCVRSGSRCNTGDDGNAFVRSLDRCANDSLTLRAIEIGELAG